VILLAMAALSLLVTRRLTRLDERDADPLADR
jgi:hypothetical protein